MRSATVEPSVIHHPAPADPGDVPIPYMARTRAYYQALGYAEPYRWAHYAEVPFAPLVKPLSDSRIGLVTTGALFDPAHGDQGPGARYNAAAKFHRVYAHPTQRSPDVRISHVTYDRAHTSAKDPNCWFPLPQLERCALDGLIGAVSPRFYGVPTTRSQRTTLEQDAPDVLAAMRADKVDVAVLVPNCPICHQVVSLTARHLEAAGIPTVVMGCAKDVVEHVGVPRFLFSDFPLGNAAGKPHDSGAQILTIDLAFELLAMAPVARTTIQSPLRWRADAAWKRDFCNIEHLSAAELEKLRAAHEDHRGIARAARTRPSGE